MLPADQLAAQMLASHVRMRRTLATSLRRLHMRLPRGDTMSPAPNHVHSTASRVPDPPLTTFVLTPEMPPPPGGPTPQLTIDAARGTTKRQCMMDSNLVRSSIATCDGSPPYP